MPETKLMGARPVPAWQAADVWQVPWAQVQAPLAVISGSIQRATPTTRRAGYLARSPRVGMPTVTD